MKKQTLMHLHGLLGYVQDFYEEETGDTVYNDEYADLGVKPVSIHKSKTDHKRAIFALVRGITSEMHSITTEQVDSTIEKDASESSYGSTGDQAPRQTSGRPNNSIDEELHRLLEKVLVEADERSQDWRNILSEEYIPVRPDHIYISEEEAIRLDSEFSDIVYDGGGRIGVSEDSIEEYVQESNGGELEYITPS